MMLNYNSLDRSLNQNCSYRNSLNSTAYGLAAIRSYRNAAICLSVMWLSKTTAALIISNANFLQNSQRAKNVPFPIVANSKLRALKYKFIIVRFIFIITFV